MNIRYFIIEKKIREKKEERKMKSGIFFVKYSNIFLWHNQLCRTWKSMSSHVNIYHNKHILYRLMP